MRCTRVAIVGVLSALLSGGAWPSPATAQDTGHVAFLRADPTAYGPGAWPARATAAKAFYATHRDAYDFLILFPTFPIDLSRQSPGEVLGTHWPVRNDVSGIGIERFDLGSEFGSSARLKAVIDVHSLVPGVQQGGFDAAVATVAHEIAHQWAARVAFRDRRTGQTSRALLGHDGSHWSYFLDSDASVLYGADWRDAGAGRFVADASRKRYSALDLYLMGFLGKEEVPPFTLLEPEAGSSQSADALPPQDGTRVSAAAFPVAVGDVIAVEGARIPSVNASQKIFRSAFAVLTPLGVKPTADQIAFVDAVRREWTNRFFFMTRGRAVMETTRVEKPSGSLASDRSPMRGAGYLLSQQAGDGSWADDPTTVTRDTAAAVRALSLHAGDPAAQAAMTVGASWLAESPAGDDDSRARRADALAMVRGSLPDGAYAGPNADGGHGLAKGYRSTVIDSALVALAERSAGRLEERPELIEFLLAAQRGDGGWPRLPGAPSSVEPTAWALRALAGSTIDVRLAASRDAGLAFLRASRRSDGSFGDDFFSGPSFTAEAVLALDAWGVLGPDDAGWAAESLLNRQREDGSWSSSVHETAKAVEALRVLLAPNLALGPVLVARTDVFQGEPVVLTTTIRNEGRGTAASVRVRAFDSAGVAFSEEASIAALRGGETRALQLTLDTAGRAGNDMVFVVADPDGVIDESREDDNRVGATLRILPTPLLADPYVVPGTLLATPATVDSVPTAVRVEASIGNAGGVDTNAILTAYVRDVLAAEETGITLPAGSLHRLSLDVPVGGGSWPAVIRLSIRGAGPEPEASEANNDAFIEIQRVPSVDLVVLDLAVAPVSPEQGSPAIITWKVGNRGTLPASGVVDRVRIVGASGQLAALIQGDALSVPSGGAVERRVTWRPEAVGTMTVEVDAAHPAERNPADNVATTAVSVTPSTRPNLYARAADLTITPDPALEAGSFEARVVVRNGSAVAAGPFDVAFFDGDPAAGRLAARSAVSGLAGNGSVEIAATYQVPTDQEITVVVQVDPDGAVDEFDEGDNTVVRVVPVLSLPDLAVDSGSIRPSNPFPRENESVAVVVSVSNVGGQAAPASAVRLYDGAPETGGKLLGSRELALIPPGAAAEAEFAWIATGGMHEVVAVVSATGFRERGGDNNRATRAVMVQNGDVAAVPPYFSPNGDGVRDETVLAYRLAEPGDATAVVTDSEGRAVRSLEGPPAQAAGTIAWDGRRTDGVVAPDGLYRMTLLVSQGGARRVVGTADVVLDVNRSRLEAAAGTALIDAESLEGRIPKASYFEWTFAAMPDDSGIAGYGCVASGICGIYTLPIGGGAYSFVTPPGALATSAERPWRMAVSPDLGRVAFLVSGPANEGALMVYSLADRSFRKLGDPEGVDYLAPVVWNPDGTEILIRTRSGVKAVAADGTGSVILHPTQDVAEFAYSPDGEYVSVLSWGGEIRLYRRDGSEGVIVAPEGSVFYPDHDLAWRHAWTANGSAIAFAHAETGISYVDLSTLEIRPMFLAPDEEQGQFGGLASLAASPTELAVAFIYEPGGRWSGSGTQLALSTADGAPPLPLHEAFGGDALGWAGWSPLETFAWAMRWPSSSNAWNWDLVRSLANLTARLTAVREPGKSYVTFRGTAADLNFDGFEIRVRRDAPGELERVVARGSASVVSGALGEWTPARDGVYEAVLVARDLAGNVREHRIRFGWSRSSVISNTRREPEYVSPNGDGVQDVVVISYATSAPTTVSAWVENSSGVRVRTLEATHLTGGEFTLEWNARDDLGWLLPDGEYTIGLGDRRFRVVVDTTPPAVEMELASDLSAGPGTEFGKSKVFAFPDYLRWNPQVDGGEKVDDAFMNVALRAQDTNLEAWTLVELDGPEAVGGLQLQRGGDVIEQHVLVPMFRVAGRTYRLTAIDRAGNRGVAQRAPPERIYAVALGLSDETLDVDDFMALMVGNFSPPYRVAPALFVHADPIGIPVEGGVAGLVPHGRRVQEGNAVCDMIAAPGRLTIFFSESIVEPLTSLSILHRRFFLGGSGLWTETELERPQVVGDQAVVWNSGDLTSSPLLEFKLAARGITGRVFESPVFRPRCADSVISTTCVSGQAVTVGLTDPEVLAAENASLQVESLDAPGSLTIPIRVAGSTVAPGGAQIPISSLAGCRHEIKVSWGGAMGSGQASLGVVNVCGAALGETTVSGTRVTTSVVENYPSAVRDVEIYARAREDSPPVWRLVGRTGPFDGTSPAVRLDTDSYGLCAEVAFRLVTVLPDGQRVEESTRTERPLCGGGQAANLECGALAVSEPVATGSAPRCVSRQPEYAAAITGRGAVPFVNVEATLLTSAGLPVRQVPVSGFAPASTFAASATISGYGLTDGRYLLGARATDENEKTYEARSERWMIVDTAPPQARIDSPGAGIVCLAGDRKLAVTGLASDANIARYTAWLRPEGDPQELQSKVVAGANAAGTLATFDLAGMPAGAYALGLEVRDLGGNAVCPAEVRIEIPPAPSIEALSASPLLFSPDGDGTLDSVDLTFEARGGAEIVLALRSNGQSRAIATLPGNANGYRWTGALADGSVPADGAYALDAAVSGPCGGRVVASTAVEIDTRPPLVRIDQPASGSTVSTAGPVVGAVADVHLAGYRVSLGEGGEPVAFLPVSAGAAPAGPTLATLPLGGMAPGTYTVLLEAWDAAGHTASTRSVFTWAPGALLERLEVAPVAVSPNGDGMLDGAIAAVHLASAALIDLDLVSADGGLVRPVAIAAPGIPGAQLFPLDSAVGSLPDGSYQVRVTANAGTTYETAQAPLAIDRVPPEIVVTSPSLGSFVRRDGAVLGSIDDPLLLAWSLRTSATGDREIASGTAPAGGVLAVLPTLPDGQHTVSVAARDSAGNRREVVVPFTVDTTEPEPSITMPLAGSHLSGRDGPVLVTGTLVEANPASWRLEISSPGEPDGWRVLAGGQAFPAGGTLLAWDALAEPDGPATLRLVTVDRAGNEGAAVIDVFVDNTVPFVAISSPRDAFLRDGEPVRGSVSDANLVEYVVELAEGGGSQAFFEIARGTGSVAESTLAALANAPREGTYQLRVTAIDLAGNSASDVAGFAVDRTPPRPPTALHATLRRPSDAALTWNPSPDGDVVAYRVLRAIAGGGAQTVGATEGATTWTDAALRDGEYRYSVVAVDAAGLVSGPSPEAALAVDTKPPLASISRPAPGSRVRGLVDISGTAFSDRDFKEYRLSFGTGAAPVDFTPVRRATAPVVAAPLGTLDTTAHSEGATLTFRLESEDLAGNVAEARTTVEVDNVAPPAPVLLSAVLSGADVILTWGPMGVPDLGGFIVWRNGIPVSVPEGADLTEPTAFLIPAGATTWRDRDVPDGTFVYQVQAVDLAGNASALSNERSVSLDRRTPKAVIATPSDLSRLSGSVDVVAECPDRDLAWVQLEARSAAAGGAFVPLGSALTTPPYLAVLDTSAFGAAIELRARAADRGGKIDSTPASVFVFRAPPLQPAQVQPHVDESLVAITISDPNSAGSVAGIAVERLGYVLDPTTSSPKGIASASSTSSGTPAMGVDGNWSTCWRPSSTPGQWWQQILDRPHLIQGVTLYGLTGTSDLLLRVSGAWVPVRRSVPGGTQVLEFDPPLAADAMRVAFSSAGGTLCETVLSAEAVSVLPVSEDFSWTNDDQLAVYSVTAIGQFGQRAPASASARIYAPVLEPGLDVVGSPEMAVAGGNATAGSLVRISIDGVPAGEGEAGRDGRFSIPVMLREGDNVLVARATDALGNVSRPSAAAWVRYERPPDVSIALSLEGFSGSEVFLTFVVVGDESRVDAYELLRAAGGPEGPVARAGVGERSFRDTGLRNGTYTYRVRAMSASGISGAPSNAVQATIAIPGPAAPERPVITEPTIAGRPITSSRARVTLAGLAELGARVELWRNGQYAGADLADVPVQPVAIATTLPATGFVDVGAGGEPLAYAYEDSAGRGIAVEWPSRGETATFPIETWSLSAPRVSPDDLRVAFSSFGSDWTYRTYLIELPTGVVLPAFPGSPGGESDLAWSPDGTRLAFSVPTTPAIGLLDVASGLRQEFTVAAPAVMLAWLDDVSIGYRAGNTSLVALDVTSGIERELARRDVVWSWAPARATGDVALSGVAGGGARVWLLQGTAEIDLMEGLAPSLAFSPDGRALAASVGGRILISSSPWGPPADFGDVEGDLVTWPSAQSLYVSGYGVLTRLDRGGDGRFEIPVDLAVGPNTFVAFSTDPSGSRSAPSDLVEVALDPAGIPDLAIEASVQPQVPQVGASVQAVLRVRNLGASSQGGTIGVTASTADGTVLRLPQISVPPLAPGASSTAFATLPVTSFPGEVLLTAVVDPVLGDGDRDTSNNRAEIAFTVLEGAGTTMAMTARPSLVEADGQFTVEFALRNGGPAVEAVLRVELADDGGVAVSLPVVPVSLGSLEARNITVLLPVGHTLAGDYRLGATLTSGAGVLAEAAAPVTIGAERTAVLALVSERAYYRPGEEATFLTTVRNASRNAPLVGATLRIDVHDTAGRTVASGGTSAIPALWMGGSTLVPTRIRAGLLPAGAFTARATVELDGVALAEGIAPFEVLSEPLLAGFLAVQVTSDPPVVRSGGIAVTNAVLRNLGTGTAMNVGGHIVLIDPGGAEVARWVFTAGDLAPFGEAARSVLIPTAGLPLGVYGLTLVAEYDGRLETLATARFRLADSQPPQLALLAPADGSHVRGAVTPRVRATDDASGVAAVRASVAGQVVPFALNAGYPQDGTWSGAISLGPDGSYEVVVSASDAEGNDGLATPTPANPIRLNIVSDTTPPVVRITGVTPDSLLNTPVTPVIEAEDLNLARVDARLGGAPFPGGEIGQDGDHSLVATATDRAGNSATARVAFSIDRTPPSIAIVGVDDGAYLPFDVTPTLVVTDAHLEGYSATLDGAPLQEGVPLTAERTYAIAVTARDRAGNTSSADRTFTIDKTPPRVEIAGVSDGSIVSGSVTPLVTVEDANLLASEVSLDGSPFASGSPVSEDGLHHLRAVGLDRAGNRTERSVWFALDGTPPSIAIAGVVEGEITARDVVPVVTVEDANLSTWTTTIDGVEWPLGGGVTTEGVHVLEVTATDLAGNVATRSLTFEIDRTAPVLWASVEDGATYPDAVRVEFGADDRNLATVSATLDGAPVSSGLSVLDGSHVLAVTARDVSGNEASQTYRFEILSVRYAVEKRIIDRHARVLALLPCDPVAAARVEAFLREALPGVPLATVQTDVDLLVQLRTGVHGVVVIAADDRPISCVPASVAPPIPQGQLRLRVEKELTEAVFRGAGVVVLREDQSAWPQLVEALGLRFLGQQPAGSVALRPSAVSGPMRLLTSDGVELKLESAHEIGVFESDGRTAAAVHQFGLGAAATVGFDASRAGTTADAAALVAGAVAFVTPEAGLFPRGVVAIGIDVTNESRPTTTRVRESLDPALELVTLLGGGVQLPSGELEWRCEQQSGATEHLVYVVRMPSSAGTYRVTTEVANVVGGEARAYGTYVLDLNLARGESDALGSAVLLAQAIPSKGADASNRAKILKLLSDVAANTGATAQDRERAIADLLAAVDEVKALRTVDRTPLRLAIGELLAAWEARP